MVAWFKFEDPASELAFVSLGDRCETSRNAREMRNEMCKMCKSSQSLVYNTPTTHKKGKAARAGELSSLLDDQAATWAFLPHVVVRERCLTSTSMVRAVRLTTILI